MKPSSHKSRLLLGAVSATALFLTSCVVTDYPSVYTSPGYTPTSTTSYQTVATVPTGLIRTTSSYWYYDPFRRSYYDARRRAYYNYLSSRYYRTPPTRYSTRRYPSGWNGYGTCPLPRNIHNHARVTHNTYNNHHVNHHTRVHNVNHDTRVHQNNSRSHYVNHNQGNKPKPKATPKPKLTTKSKLHQIVKNTTHHKQTKTQTVKAEKTSSKVSQRLAMRQKSVDASNNRSSRFER